MASHERTLGLLFEHPTSHNIEWRDVDSLLNAVGSATEGASGAVHVTVNGQSVVVHRPKHKDVPEELVIELRHFLRRAGIEPPHPVKGPGSD